MSEAYLAIDQGTTGTTAALIDAKNFQFIGKVNHEYPQIYPKPGLVEHDLNVIWATVGKSITDVLNKFSLSPQKIIAIGITNQRETTCAFDRTGAPIANAIVWQDRRTADFCQKLGQEKRDVLIKEKTGLPVDAYFSATKMKWLLENDDTVTAKAKEGNLLFGTIDTYLLYRLTAGNSFYTETSNASRTLLMNLKSGDWDEELGQIFGVGKDFLPEIKDSFGDFGKTAGLSFLPDGIPITGILGDQQAALFGQAGISRGDFKCTYGTGAFLLLNTGEEIKVSTSGLLSTAAYSHDNKIHYALEGSCYIAGAAVQWLRDNLKIIPDSPSVEALAKQVNDLTEMKNILFLPFFTGIASPYWNSNARAAIVGLTRDTANAHIARACLEGVAYSIQDLINALKKDIDFDITSLKVDGGMCQNDLLLQMQSTTSNLEIIRPQIIETTAYGAALACAIGADNLKLNQIKNFWREDKRFAPTPDSLYYAAKYHQWTQTIQTLF